MVSGDQDRKCWLALDTPVTVDWILRNKQKVPKGEYSYRSPVFLISNLWRLVERKIKFDRSFPFLFFFFFLRIAFFQMVV